MKTYPLHSMPAPIERNFALVRCAIAKRCALRFHYPKDDRLEFRVVQAHKMVTGAQGQWLVECYDYCKKAPRQFTVVKMVNLSLPRHIECGPEFYRNGSLPNLPPPAARGVSLPPSTSAASNSPAGDETEPAGPRAAATPAPILPTVRPKDLEDGWQRRAVLLALRAALRTAGLGGRLRNPPTHFVAPLARRFNVAPNTVVKWSYASGHLEDHELTSEAVAPAKPSGGASPSAATADDLRVVRANRARLNRTRDDGSSEEAARQALRENRLTPAFAAEVKARAAAGRPLLTPAQRRATKVPKRVVHALRNLTEAGLRYVWSPGTLKLIHDEDQERFARAGDILEMDDGSKNFYCCVPWTRAGVPDQPCADKYGVLLGRFQLLLAVDAGEYFIPGYGHTARPRDSYRQMDILSVLHGLFQTHGFWKRCRFERGSFEGHAVQAALAKVGTELHTVHSPHAKAFVEGMFNLLWTKTSHLPGQIGRFRGETEKEYALVQKCRRGTEDPRQHFPMLADTLAALDTACLERNATWVKSAKYGRWVPEQRFDLRKTMGSFSPWDPTVDYLFSPCSEVRTICGWTVKASVPYMHWEDASGRAQELTIQYEWGDPSMGNFDGQKVRLWFDPFGPDPSATICRLNPDGTAGQFLCRAEQRCAVARAARASFGYGNDELPDSQRSGQHALRQDVRTFKPFGQPSLQRVEIRTGAGRTDRLEINGRPPAEALPPVRWDPAARPQSAPACENPRLAELMAEREREFAPA